MQLKRAFKRTGIGLLVIAVLLLSAHLFIVYKAKEILNFMVMEASHGRYTLKSKKVKFKYFPLAINASQLELLPVDSTEETTFYIVTADSISIQVPRLVPLFSQKNLTLENFKIIRPLVKVNDHHISSSASKKPLNLALADMQHVLVSTLADFHIRNCSILDAGIAYQQYKDGQKPFYVNHVTLNINNLQGVRLNPNNDSAFSFKADIKLQLTKPDIQLPDSTWTVFVENLLVDTRRNIFSVNKFSLYSRNNNGAVDSANLSNIRVKNFNWNRWLKDGHIEIDSVRASNGSVFYDLSEKQLFHKKGREEKKAAKPVNINMLLHKIEINTMAYALRVGTASGPLTLQLSGDSLAVGDLSLSNNDIQPLKVQTVAFKLSGFSDSYDNEKSQSTFEKLIINHDQLQLINYRRTLDFKNIGAGSYLNIPSLRVEKFSLDDLLEYKLTADKLLLESPTLVIDIHKSGKQRDADATVAAIASSLRPSLAINKLSIHDASIILLPNKNVTGKVSIENLSTEIDAKRLLASHSVMDIIASATALSSSGFKISGPNVNLLVQRSALNENMEGLFFEHIIGNVGKKLFLDLNGVRIVEDSKKFDVTRLQQIPLDKVFIEGGTVSVDLNASAVPAGANQKTPAFSIGDLNTGSLNIKLSGKDKEVKLADVAIQGDDIRIENGDVTWNSIAMNTGNTSFASGKLAVEASAVQIRQPGEIVLSNITFIPAGNGFVKSISVPKLTLQGNYQSTSHAKIASDKITIEEPIIELTKQAVKTEKNSAKPYPDFDIKQLVIQKPSFMLSSPNGEVQTKLNSSDGTVLINKLKSSSHLNAITAAAFNLQLEKAGLRIADKNYDAANVQVQMKNIYIDGNDKNKITALVDTASAYNFNLQLDGERKTIINTASGGISNYAFSSTDSISIPLLVKRANWWVSAKEVKRETKNHSLTIFNPYVTPNQSVVRFDSLHLIPLISRDSFWSTALFEKDYNTLRLGATELHNWAFTGEKEKRELHVGYLLSDNLSFLAEKDKTHGPDTVSYRPLLARSFSRMPMLFSVDTLHLVNATVRHNVIPEKSKKQATIYFTNINGFVYNIRNRQITEADTLKFRLNSKLMGKADLQVGFRQAYLDSVQGFSLRAKMGRLELATLNPLLVPLVSVKIDKGIADSLTLAVGANDYLAYGTMDMRYHRLRLALLKNGEKKYFLSGFANWLINVFVHSNDNSRKDVIFQERLRNKGIYNFWGKIAINGLLANLGVKRDKKQIKKYRKAIKRDMPAVDQNLL